MDTTVDALKSLYVALGGQLTDTYESIADGIAVSDYVLIPDVIQAIAQKASTAVKAELPAVTKADEGSVLKVNSDGKWDKGTDEIQA